MGPSPLSRFLPPLEEGSTASALKRFGAPGDLVLDPFGASPRLAVEAAQAGRAVLVAVNNPVTRHVLWHTAQPYSLGDLQSALGRLGNAPKDGGRLEAFMLDLYTTRCSRCEEWISAEYFVWDRDEGEPILRFYACDHCNHTVEEPTTEDDRRRAHAFDERKLQHALALEEVAPRGSPDRAAAEAALAVYPSRAVFALVSMLNKYQQLEANEATSSILLSAMDQANSLWGRPEGRPRPLQLTASAQFLENNAWKALERTAGHWAVSEPGVPIVSWTGEYSPDPGTITVFPGPVRELVPHLPGSRIERILTVIPRPNQAFWTLSALWTAWLWGREAAEPILPALRRRRYDWAWHSGALKSTLRAIWRPLSDNVEILGFIPDAEPGFIAATLAGFDSAGFALTGRAVRMEGQALFTWKGDRKEERVAASSEAEEEMKDAAVLALNDRGSPEVFALPHAAAWTRLAQRRALGRVAPSETRSSIGVISEVLESVLADRSTFIHFSRGVEAESGRYWLVDESSTQVRLSDRVEDLVLARLRSRPATSALELEIYLCEQLPGLMTPDRRLIMAALRSYATYDPHGAVWSLRTEDDPEARRLDMEQIVELLSDLGRRLGLEVQQGYEVIWSGLTDQGLRFRVSETAKLMQIGTAAPGEDRDEIQAIVIPGGRGALVAEKARGDPRLRDWLESGPLVLKFRHIRRLSEDTTLDRDNLLERLALDPPGQEDPQLPLL